MTFAPPGLLQVKIYCTRLQPSDSPTLQGPEYIAGRPNFNSLLEEVIENSDFSDWVSVATCGPSPMTRDLATATSAAIKPGLVFRGEHRVGFSQKVSLVPI